MLQIEIIIIGIMFCDIKTFFRSKYNAFYPLKQGKILKLCNHTAE